VRCLGFTSDGAILGGRRVRALAFQERSQLPVSAVCVVASGVREVLGGLIGETVALKLYEPAIPSPAAWPAIVRDATIFRVRGTRADAAVILRAGDAAALAAAAFGEHEANAGGLSALERTVLERTVRAIATQFGPICGVGTPAPQIDVLHDARGFTTFFELQLEHPVRARIGIALSRDPLPESHSGISRDDLLDLELELAVRFDLGDYPAVALAALEPGALLPLTGGARRGTLCIAGSPLAHGECGVNGSRYALLIDRTQFRRDQPAS
jgi:hypothetical protein